jgi:Holliday junction resolvasome RuvABC DNA-binding subunit
MVNLFGTYNEEEKILKDLKTTMSTFQNKVDMCTSKPPNRQTIEFLEEFAIEKLGFVENNIAAMMDKLDIF